MQKFRFSHILFILFIFSTRLSVSPSCPNIHLNQPLMEMWPRTPNYGREKWFPGQPAFGVVGGHWCLSASVEYLGSLKADFSESPQIACLAPAQKRLLLHRKIFWPHSRSVDNSGMPQVTADRFFRISLNRIFEPQKAYFCTQKNFISIVVRSTTSAFLS